MYHINHHLEKLIPTDQFDIGGYPTGAKIDLLFDLIVRHNLKNAVEIGVWKGKSLLAIANGMLVTKGKVTGIDPWEFRSCFNEIPWDKKLIDHIMYNLVKDQEGLDNIYNKLMEIIKTSNLHMIEIIRDKSENVYKKFEINSVDLLHIDGNHDEEFVCNDIANYFPLVISGGFIVMDDCIWPGVKIAIEKYLLLSCDHIYSDQHFAVYRKK